MNPFTSLKKELATALGRTLAAESITVEEEFPLAPYHTGAAKRRIAVGFAGVELPGDKGLARLTLRFELLCPGDDRQGCHALFEALAGALMTGGYGIGKLTCGEVAYRQELDCLCCTAMAELAGIFSGGEETEACYREILIKTKGV